MELPRVLSEDTLDMAAAGELVKRDAKTVQRWARSGVTVRGERVRLEAARNGCHWVTSREAVVRFLARLQPVAVVSEVVTPTELGRRLERSRKGLRALGVKC
jgi:hypothetical protein